MVKSQSDPAGVKVANYKPDGAVRTGEVNNHSLATTRCVSAFNGWIGTSR